jgi:hypothetical protein
MVCIEASSSRREESGLYQSEAWKPRRCYRGKDEGGRMKDEKRGEFSGNSAIGVASYSHFMPF